MNNEKHLLGTVMECLPNLEYRVHLDGTPEGETVRCYMAGKMRIGRIHILIGDVVECVVPKGSAVGRVVYRRVKKHWEK